MSSPSDWGDRAADTCHLCGDVAVEGRVVELDAHARTATVALACGIATVALDLVDARVGDTLLVHLGFAITRLDDA